MAPPMAAAPNAIRHTGSRAKSVPYEAWSIKSPDNAQITAMIFTKRFISAKVSPPSPMEY